MKENVTLKDVMNREFVGVSESDDLDAAVRLMRQEGSDSAVVLRGREPAGILTPTDVLDAVAGDHDTDQPVSRVMSTTPPVLSPESSLDDAVAAMVDGVRNVLVVEGEEVVGTVDARDVVTASATLTNAAEERARVPVEPVEAAAGDAEYSTQSICEVCGSLTHDLSNFNGQLICSDCIEI